MARLVTVNIVEYVNNTIFAVHSFTDDESGNLEAEELFTRLATENGAPLDDMSDFIEDGVYDSNTYQVFITHALAFAVVTTHGHNDDGKCPSCGQSLQDDVCQNVECDS